MENIIYDNTAYTKAFNQGWELLQTLQENDMLDVYATLAENLQGKEEIVSGIRDALKQHEQMLKEVDKSKTVKKDKDKGLDMEM